MNRLENMETFVRVVETGGISAASESLHIAKSAVSRRLKELETHLGIELFHRNTRNINLTDTGHNYYINCLKIFDEITEAEQEATQAHGMIKGNLKVALPSTFGLMHVGPIINEFLTRYPKINFELDFNDRKVDLMKEGFDLAIRITKMADSNLVARPISNIQFAVCASPEYLQKHQVPKTPNELLHHNCLVYSLGRESDYWHFFNADGQETSIKVNPYLRTSSGEFLLSAAIAGQGIVLLPKFIVYDALVSKQLEPLFSDYEFSTLNAYAVYPYTRHLSQRVRVFVEFLIEKFRTVPY